ncbi:hypothetical protein TNCV_3139981 [Trichonephila clavipes]|nr:hypothetical protein TNCV_3139981 [Trichonephila clavipes]
MGKGQKLFNDGFVSSISFTEPDNASNENFVINCKVRAEMKKRELRTSLLWKFEQLVRNIGRYSLHPIFSNSLAIKKPLSAITTSFGSKRSISLLLIKTSLSDILPVNNSDMKLIAPLGVMPIIPLKVLAFCND